MKLESWQSSEERGKFKIVRTDDYTDVPGEIIAANEATGEAKLKVGDETKEWSFGSRGIRIVLRGRR